MSRVIEVQTCSIFNYFKILILEDISISYNCYRQCRYNISNLIPLGRVSWPVFDLPVFLNKANIRKTNYPKTNITTDKTIIINIFYSSALYSVPLL
jgi:hypothetical protein